MKRDQADTAPTPFAVGSGRMASLVRSFDWTRTPLGPGQGWPPELRTAVAMILDSRFPAAVLWGPRLVTIYNDAFRPILGDKPEALGRPFNEVWPEVWDEIGPLAARALEGEAIYVEDFPLEVDRFGRPEHAWFTFCYSPIRLIDGPVVGVLDTVLETTAGVRARTELDVVTHELRHRLKNTLATVQAIARRSLRDVGDRAAVNAFLDRIVAMGMAHDVLFAQGWLAVSVADVANTTLAPFRGQGRVSVSGPPIHIGPHATVALSLLLHELATNATKYGSLSIPGGRAIFEWAVDHDTLRLDWRETGGPPCAEPSHVGFGSRLIEMGLGRGSRVARRYLATGLEVQIEAPLSQLI